MEQKENKNFKHILRIANTDLDGNKPILGALRKIKGVGFMFSNIICVLTSIDEKKKTGDMTDEEVKKIQDILKDPSKFNCPGWMLNRRKDYGDGQNKHLLSEDLVFFNDNDKKRLKKIKSYKGVRHISNLPARGQKTKSNFRRNKGKVHLGVKKKGGKAGRV